MADKTAIEWTDATWNPIAGCSVVSPGCTNCYAMAMAARIERMTGGALNAIAVREKLRQPSHYSGLTKPSKTGPVWTGKIAQAPDSILTKPLQWKKPRRIFVNSMSDLFHESVPDEWIDRIFAVMALAPQHTFQVLTKRSKRILNYMSGAHGVRARRGFVGKASREIEQSLSDLSSTTAHTINRIAWGGTYDWPLPNVWLGVTAEDQPRADERRDDLEALARQGWTTFCSYEPALGGVDWSGWEFLRQLIAGGESGPKARPPHPDWVRASRDWSARAGVAFYFKQWGEWETAIDRDNDDPDWRKDYSSAFSDGGKTKWLNLAGGSGFHGDRFHVMRRVGKRRAGDLLDGVEHKAFPE